MKCKICLQGLSVSQLIKVLADVWLSSSMCDIWGFFSLFPPLHFVYVYMLNAFLNRWDVYSHRSLLFVPFKGFTFRNSSHLVPSILGVITVRRQHIISIVTTIQEALSFKNPSQEQLRNVEKHWTQNWPGENSYPS